MSNPRTLLASIITTAAAFALVLGIVIADGTNSGTMSSDLAAVAMTQHVQSAEAGTTERLSWLAFDSDGATTRSADAGRHSLHHD